MKNFAVMYILFFTLSPAMLFAEETLDSCEESGKTYASSKVPPSAISTDCYPLILEQLNDVNTDTSSDGKLRATGARNLLYIQKYDSDSNLIAEFIQSGDNSKLYDIKALDYNDNDQRIYILNQDTEANKQVYSYRSNRNGNHVPLRELVNTQINNATNLRISGEEMFLLSSTHKWVKVFNRLADPDGKQSIHSTAMLRSFQSEDLIQPIDLVIYANEVFILDSDRVLVFKKSDNGTVSPKRIISGDNTQMSGAKKLELNSNNQLEITNGDESILKFSTTSEGNAFPL